MMLIKLKAVGAKLLPGFILAAVVFAALLLWEHRHDHRYLHALIDLERQRQAYLKQQQDAQATALKGAVVTPERPAIASSPVPEPGRK